MRKATLILTVVLLVLTMTGCKKSDGASFPVSISFCSINPKAITGDQTAFVSVMVSNLKDGETVLVKALVAQGIVNPAITYTTGNPVYVEYFPPAMAEGSHLEAVIAIVVTDLGGKELDRADVRVQVNY